MEQAEQMQQLVQSIQSLTTALAEERQERLKREKRQRLSLAAMFLALGMAVWFSWPMTTAQANNIPAVVKELEFDFKELTKLIVSLNGMLDKAQKSMEKGTLYDMGILANRIKQDSDVIRKFMLSQRTSPHPALQIPNSAELNEEYASPSIVLESAGAGIKEELRFLNAHIMELSYYMRSTLGKASNWMNWMPTP